MDQIEYLMQGRKAEKIGRQCSYNADEVIALEVTTVSCRIYQRVEVSMVKSDHGVKT